MNLPVIFSKAAAGVKLLAGNGVILAKKHAPEILIGGGIAGFVLTIVETVKATNDTNDIHEEKECYMNQLDASYAEGMLTDADYQNETRSVKRWARKKIIGAWWKVGTTGLVSVILVLKGYRVVNGRYVAVSAAYKSLEAFTERYRGNVIDEFGKDIDWRMANSVRKEDWGKAEQERRDNQQIREDNALKKGKKKPLKSQYRELYKFRFDERSPYWKRFWTPDQFLDYIRWKTRELNDKFMIQGYLFLNDVLDAFGLEKVPEGQVLGWIRKRGKTTVISVGYDEMPEEEIRRILATERNDELYFYLQPNYDGVVYNLIDSVSRVDGYLVE